MGALKGVGNEVNGLEYYPFVLLKGGGWGRVAMTILGIEELVFHSFEYFDKSKPPFLDKGNRNSGLLETVMKALDSIQFRMIDGVRDS